MNKNFVLAPALCWALSPLCAELALGATATANLNVKIEITSECIFNSTPDLDFGSIGVIAASRSSATTVGVQCTSGTPYSVGFGAGNGAGATVAVRKMTGPSAQTVQYTLYRDSGHTQIWGSTVGTDTVAGTGNGANQTLDVYGLVPAQTTPGVGSYADIVTATITY